MRQNLSILFLSVASALLLHGQRADAQQDFRVFVETNPYLSWTNAAALGHFREDPVSMAELGARKDDGGLKSISESGDAAEADVVTESFMRMSERMAFHGRLSYSYFAGKAMTGPVLMDPSYNPVNFLESSMDNAGAKHREMYGLTGDMAYGLGRKWTAGLGFDYEAGDQTKAKDPRFNSKWMDLKLAPGLFFNPSDRFGVGMALQYRSTLEMVLGGIYGVADKQYFINTDRGCFFGTTEELSGDYNFMPTSTSRPMANAFYGASIQVMAGADTRFFSELSLLYRDGYYGKRSSTTATFFEFGGLVAAYDASLVIKGEDNLHKVGLDASVATLGNNENKFKYVTPTGQNTVVEYYAQDHVSDRMTAHAGLSYDGWTGMSGDYPSLAYGAKVEADYVEQSVEVYPMYRDHNHFRINAEAHAEKSIFGKHGFFTVGAAAAFMAGSGTMAKDGAHASVSSTSLKSFDQYMCRQYEFDTASRASGTISLRYTRSIGPSMAAYICARNTFASMFSAPEYLEGKSRNTAVLTVGCSF